VQLCDFEPISAFSLGAIERLVSVSDQFFSRFTNPESCNADADGDLPGIFRECQGPYSRPDAFSDNNCSVSGSSRQQQDELVAAESGRKVVGPKLTFEDVPKLS
jgi:hypothetical protein